MRIRRLLAAKMVFVAAVATAWTASADTVTFRGSSIALRGCTIQAVQGGQVFYADPGGQRQRRPLEQVAALGFDGLPDLDQAEAAIGLNDLDAALMPLLRALLRCETDLQRLWVRMRLAQVHDQRGEYVQAAGHAAAAMGMSNDVALRSLRPVSPVNRPALAAAVESSDNLHAALRQVTSGELKSEIETMLRAVTPVRDSLVREAAAPAVASDTTVSGILKSDVLKAASSIKPSAASVPAVVSSQPTQAPQSPVGSDGGDPLSPQALEQLLQARDAAEALARCERIAAAPGERDLARFLYQYGRALALSGRARDAAVMFTRCAVLYPDASVAPSALVETAVICRDEFGNHAAARRLLQEVIDSASNDEHTATVMLARELLRSLPDV